MTPIPSYCIYVRSSASNSRSYYKRKESCPSFKKGGMPPRNKKLSPHKSGAGMTEAGVKAYREKNPGSKLQTAVTEKSPTGKRAARRKSFCARSAGQMKKFPKAAKDPN